MGKERTKLEGWRKLVLSRREGEAIVIDGPAIIETVKARSGRASTAIYAPPSTTVLREEVEPTHKR